jgi:anti-sigma regulatory factor (Ser/Thr protein kinase)
VLRLSLPPRRTSARRLRAALAVHLSSNDVPRATINEVLLAADEAFINAFMHAGDVSGAITVRAQVLDDRILVEIRDRGCGFDVRALDIATTPDPLVAHGRGLFLIHQVMDQVEVRSTGSGQGTLVRMAKSFPGRPPQTAESMG